VVGAQRSRIYEHLFRSCSSSHIQYKKVLARYALRVEIATASFARNANRIYLDQFRQPLSDRFVSRQRLQRSLRTGVLDFDPRACFRAILIFEPAVGVGDRSSVPPLSVLPLNIKPLPGLGVLREVRLDLDRVSV
jgi:hypothetical protein